MKTNAAHRNWYWLSDLPVPGVASGADRSGAGADEPVNPRLCDSTFQSLAETVADRQQGMNRLCGA
jgi:hypothetical protein